MKAKKSHKSLYKFAGMSLIAVLIIWVLSIGIIPHVLAAPNQQIPIYTPTPGPDGRIIYIVQPNDTLLRISIISGVPVEEIKALNNLTSDTIYEGQHLLLGYAGPAEATFTPGPTPTSTPVLPTPTPKPGVGNLCIILFNDKNGDSIREENEASIPDGEISINNRNGTVSKTATTVMGYDHECFEDLPEGEYTISVAVPSGYNTTTTTNVQIKLEAGDITYINFGAQANAEKQAESQIIPAPEGGRSPLLGLIGGLFLAAGVVIAIFAGKALKK